ncbi:MAG: hypothetical protein WC654_01590 [Patescibacteria group bacterium]
MRTCSLGGLVAFVMIFIQFWVEGVINLESRFKSYPMVSQEKAALYKQLSLTESQYALACEVNREAHRALNRAHECTMTSELPVDGPSCYQQEEAARLVSLISQDAMDEAVVERDHLAKQLGHGWMKTMLMGTSKYTHSLWSCASPYANDGFVINTTFTKTYDPV